jgi:hypothetical protein
VKLLLVAAVLLIGGGPALAAPDEAQRTWKDVRSAVRRGDYREALRVVERLLAADPNDPQALLYRTMCETRLRETAPFAPLSPARLRGLKEQLRREEQAQRRAATQQKALERKVAKEQAAWDRDLEAAQREAVREGRRRRQQAQAEAVQQARSQRVPDGPAVPPSAPAVPAVPPPAVAVAPPTTTPPKDSLELAPVTVPAGPGGPTPEPTSPSLAGRAAPPAGAMQINARQMSISPDQRVAVAEGDVEVVYGNSFLTCDRATLFTDTHDVYAEGRVRLEEGTQVFRGEMAHYNFDNKKGRFLQGTLSSPPWHEHGRSVEHLAEGVYEVTPGYLTSCEFEPPHFRFSGRRVTVFAGDKLARARNVAFLVEQVPFLYLPWMTVADRKSPFFIIPGKKKPWGPYALMGYRYELPTAASQKGTVKLDWRRHFGWGVGLDHQIESARLGQGLLKVYYNDLKNRTEPDAALPKGATEKRYRALWRHRWQPRPDTTVITDLQEYSDINFRKDLLFREEYVDEDLPESFVSSVTSARDYTLSAVARKRLNHFQSMDDALPDVTLDVRQQQIGDTRFFTQSQFGVGNFQTKRAHSDRDDDVVRADWFQQLRYALGLFQPVELTPRIGMRQTYYTKDRQGSDREGQRDVISGQWTMGADSSLKLFRVFPTGGRRFGLEDDRVRHVVTPTLSYTYTHEPTVANDLLNFAAAPGASNTLTLGLENKLQAKRQEAPKRWRHADVARALVSLPYSLAGSGNKSGGRFGEWAFDLELYPRSWLRIESDWRVSSLLDKRLRDSRVPAWNLDVVMVGGQGQPDAQRAPDLQAPAPTAFEPGPRPGVTFMPQGQWYLGWGHRYAANDKTESVLQWDWRLTEKWQIGAFNRFTLKEVAGGAKRFNNIREYQLNLRRDLHDWVGELAYRVDREYGEELFLTFTLKAYPELPIEMETSYHEPKIGSQSSPFSPIRVSPAGT